MSRVRIVLKELGNRQTDGQFVIGLRDGEGGAKSRQEIFQLTTLSHTMMLMDLTK